MDKGLQRDATTAVKGGKLVSCIHTHTQHTRIYAWVYIYICARILSYIIPFAPYLYPSSPSGDTPSSPVTPRTSSLPRERSISRQRCRVLHNSLAMLPDLYARYSSVARSDRCTMSVCFCLPAPARSLAKLAAVLSRSAVQN